MKGIKNGVAFVTGGENGLGEAISKKFAEEGAKVIIFGIDEKNGLRVAEECNNITEGALYIKGNVTIDSDIKNAMNIIKEKYGKLNFAVNNAGITRGLRPLLEKSEADFDSIIAVNLKGVFLSMQNELQLMLEKKSGKIVNISSEAGEQGFEGFSIYVASKHAINGMTKSAAMEYIKQGVNINCVSPGTMSTPLVAALPQEDQERLASVRPSKRLISTENVAAQTVFLCSEYANDTVGATISMDGGNTAG